MADAVIVALEQGGDFGWEWPTSAKKGWQSLAIGKPQSKLHALGRQVYWCRVDGCAYGLNYRDVPIRKAWTVMTSSRHLWLNLQKRCPGHPEHGECRGPAAQASAYYPEAMVRTITRPMQEGWQFSEEVSGTSLSQDVETYLLQQTPDRAELEVEETETWQRQVREEEPGVMALTRNRFPKEPPTGKALDKIRQMMLRIHRASGHASFSQLQKLLRARKAPLWAIELAGKLHLSGSSLRQTGGRGISARRSRPLQNPRNGGL